jgi:hypothetical protein
VDKVIHCDCGFDARAEHEDGLVAEVRRHAWEAHGMALSDDEALQLAAPWRKPVREAIPTPHTVSCPTERRSNETPSQARPRG